MSQPAKLISEEYRRGQMALHENPEYGVASVGYAPLVAQVIDAVGATELLDYGAGKGRLGETLKQHLQRPITIRHYDPARPEWAAEPAPAQCVACIDVLEHSEPDLLDNVLDDLQRVTAGTGIFSVHTGPARKQLPDGRNAHLIQQPASWWLPKFTARFELEIFNRTQNGFWIVVRNRARYDASIAIGIQQAMPGAVHPPPPVALAQDVRKLLLEALRLHQAGRFGEAAELYRSALALSPDQPDGNRLYGTLCLQTGHFDDAERHLRRALAAVPGDAEALSNLGAVLIHTGRPAGAVPCLEKSTALRPDFPDALSNLGEALRQTGDRAGAHAALSRALALDSKHANAFFNLGVLNADERNFLGAIQCFGHALALFPGHRAAQCQLANAHIIMGHYPEAEELCRNILASDPEAHEVRCALTSILTSAGYPDEACEQIEIILAAVPDHPRALVCLGNILRQAGRLEEALDLFHRLIRLGQEEPRALGGVVDTRIAMGDFEGALKFAEEAVRRFPEEGLLYLDLGVAQEKLCRPNDACNSYRAGLRLLPDHPALHFNLGTQLLLLGRFDEGWREYEWRTRLAVWGVRLSSQTYWHGESLGGKSLVIESEQGAGDTLQFVRLLPELAARGIHVVLECQPSLRRLMESAYGIAELREPGSPSLETEERHASLLSLPGILGIESDSIPSAVPYLRAADKDVAAWHERLKGDTGYRVGIAWSGNPKHMNDANRSCPISCLAPLLAVEGASFYSLQPGGGAGLQSEPAAKRVIDLTDSIGDFADTAALLMNLDLVISVDTSVAHLAGALAKPVWTLLPFAPDWRWQTQRTDSPWYPSMRLFRQPRPGGWQEPVQEAAQALAKSIAAWRASAGG
jgi:tetratricopeptide (TPR) repeat protein